MPSQRMLCFWQVVNISHISELLRSIADRVRRINSMRTLPGSPTSGTEVRSNLYSTLTRLIMSGLTKTSTVAVGEQYR